MTLLPWTPRGRARRWVWQPVVLLSQEARVSSVHSARVRGPVGRCLVLF